MVRLTDRLDMTIVVDWDVKPQIRQQEFKLLTLICGVSPRVFAKFLREMSRIKKKGLRELTRTLA